MMTRLTALSVAVLATLLAAPASATFYEEAASEFTCEPPKPPEYGDFELFDEQELPEILRSKTSSKDGDPSEAEPVADGSDQASDADLDLFREVHARYRARTEEFASEVSRIVLRKYQDEVNELRAGYEQLVGKADLEERMLREQAISAHERFIKAHPESEYTARRMFRLGELYFEESQENFLVENEKYDELSILFDEGKLEYLPEPPQKDYRKSIALYKRIVRDFTDYEDLGAVYYMLGYTYSDESSRHLDPQRAEETYLAMLDNVPESEYRAQAFFRLGDLYFEENQNSRALAYYLEILEELRARSTEELLESGRDRIYELALYKYAWATYKIDDLEGAQALFMELLDWAEEKEARTGDQTDLRPEAVRYLAISLADKATEIDASPIGYGIQALSQRGERPWSFPVLVELAGILKDQARYEEAIEAYGRLQELKPNHPRGPEFQNNVITLYLNLVEADVRSAAQARVGLTENYGLDSQWYEVNKNNKAATAAATEYILEALQSVAFTYHAAAQESEDPNDYLLAARKYIEYLERYPFAKNAYELNYYLADCYFFMGDFRFQDRNGEWTTGVEKSIEQFALLFGFPEEDYKTQAMQGIMFAFNKLWTKGEGATIDQLPESLETIRPPLGQTVQYSRLAPTELEINYIRSVRWLQREMPEDPSLPAILFDVARIYYFRNHLERAREVFEELIAAYPETDYAAFSAGFMFNSYLYTGDMARMREAATRFAGMNLGADELLREEQNATFTQLLRDSIFTEGFVAFDAERYECALLSFLNYYDKFGGEASDEEPKKIDYVVYNVAQSYSKLGKAAKSNEWYERLLADFPHSDQAPRTFWRMAGNFERVLDLEKAVQYYEDLIKYHPEDQDAVSALYNSAFLKVGMGRFEEAAATYEKYHREYTEEADAKVMLFRAAEMWEAAEDRSKAKRVYEEWLELYGADDADRWVETQWKLASFLRDEGKDGKADAKVQLIADSYVAVKADLGGIGLNISAEIAFAPLLAEFAEFELIKIEDSDIEDQEKLLAKVARIQEWNEELKDKNDAYVVEYADFEWQTAALYFKALSFKRHGEKWINAPNPFDFESEDYDEVDRAMAYQDGLFAAAKPFEDAAVAGFQLVVQFATEKKRYTDWVEEALRELSRVDPNTYPVPKPESSTVIESDALEPPAAVDELPEQQSALDVLQGSKRFAWLSGGGR
jgi:cellulose synthase operon protein C